MDKLNMGNFSINNLSTSELSIESLRMDNLGTGKRFTVGYYSRTASEQKSDTIQLRPTFSLSIIVSKQRRELPRDEGDKMLL